MCTRLSLLNHKSMPVVLNRQKDTAGLVRKQNGDRARTGVLPHVAQGSLRNSIQLILGVFRKFGCSSVHAERTLNSAIAEKVVGELFERVAQMGDRATLAVNPTASFAHLPNHISRVLWPGRHIRRCSPALHCPGSSPLRDAVKYRRTAEQGYRGFLQPFDCAL